MNNQLMASKDLLKEELFNRKKKNEAYSLRSFAKTLGVSPTYLSLVFTGQRRLTHPKALSISRKLAWSLPRRKYFTTLAEYETTSSEQDRSFLIKELLKLGQLSRQVPSLDVDKFVVISDWHHGAILTLLTLPKLAATVETIAYRLNITTAECEQALQRLLRLGLVDQDKNLSWQPTHRSIEIKSTPSKAIQIYHKEVLRKAMVAIDQQEFSEREFSNLTFTVDSKNLPIAKKRILEFKQEMQHLLEGENPTSLYQMSIQLFRVDRTKREI